MHKTEIKINGSKENSILIDISWKDSEQDKPIIIFCHGFKGFKNWGHFDKIATTFAQQNFVFVKFNFSFNGTTKNNPNDFADLDAFGKNNFTTELNDLELVIDYVVENASLYNGNKNEIYLIGHSRGGGISILKTKENKHIKKLVTWASIKDVADFIDHQNIESWKKEGVVYTFNSRTQQNMPLYYQLYEDFIDNQERLSIKEAVINSTIPHLIIHGDNDTSVPVEAATYLHQLNTENEIFILENADHTFGGKHPFTEDELPIATQLLIDKTITFLEAK